MNKWTMKFCHIVLQLDRIPRYGRLYTYHGSLKREDMTKHWEWQRRGRWGMNLLDRMGLMWKYIDATNPGWDGNTITF